VNEKKMHLSCRTLVVLLFIVIVIMAYCSVPIESAAIHRLSSHRRVHVGRRPALTKYKIKTKTKTKISYGHKKPGVIQKLKRKFKKG